MLHRYSRWDGSQAFGDLDADDVLDEIADDVLGYGDLKSALQRLLQQGMRGPEGTRMPGLKDLLDKLRAQKAQRMQRYDLGSSLEDIAKKLDDVVKTERAGIERGLQGRERERRRQALEQIPPDAAGRLRELQNYEFHDEQAEQKFQDLLASLRAQAMQPFMQGMKNALGNLTPEDLRRMREMIQDLNRMLRERAEGGEPDFAQFKAKWGSQFPGAESLDDVLEQIAQRMAQMQSLMQSLSPEQRAQLDEMMRGLFLQDERLEAAMRQLGMHLSDMIDEMTQRYRFRGDEQVGLEDAMRLMEEMQQLDALERELRGTRALEDLDRVDPAQVEKLAGEEARRDLERLQEIAKRLKDAGYLEGEDDDLKLTARAIRKIADKALRDIFARLKRDRFGGHQIDRRGAGGDQTDESKRYEFGDPFLLDLKETVMRALGRRGPGTPVRLVPDDFAVIRTEQRTQAATVVMLDMSRSMLNNGYFLPAKKVALALSALIRSQFPRDALYIVGFSLYAREFTTQQLPTLSWSEWNMGTNMHAGFMLSRRLLARHAGGNRQILMVTDGEPTAHLEGEVADFSYPPTPRTVQETLREVQRCTRERIIINTFMLERSPWLTSFVEQMARINRGRAFFATPDRLGEYLVVDYVSARRRARGA
ncbi:MAG: VWA domain-containing protein [Candidatus Rokuibacteriota bacterium]|nr:MAG: VWA domain-containing protein [Candidatus Rokubacteria bacterium]PYO18243.1 MAG: VWA domain-containing protein [Candidatus Rokubacteria bacterium]